MTNREKIKELFGYRITPDDCPFVNPRPCDIDYNPNCKKCMAWWDKEYEPTNEERKTGRWIGYDSDSDRYDEIKCSDCGKHFTVDADRFCDIGFVREDLHYCPNCGSKMEEK